MSARRDDRTAYGEVRLARPGLSRPWPFTRRSATGRARRRRSAY